MRAKYELYPAAIQVHKYVKEYYSVEYITHWQLSRSIRTLLEHVRSSKVDCTGTYAVFVLCFECDN